MHHLRQLDPALRISNLKDWLPLHRPEDLATFADNLRRAGLPEMTAGCRLMAHSGHADYREGQLPAVQNGLWQPRIRLPFCSGDRLRATGRL